MKILFLIFSLFLFCSCSPKEKKESLSDKVAKDLSSPKHSTKKVEPITLSPSHSKNDKGTTTLNYSIPSSLNFLPTSTTGVIIKHKAYTLSYVETHEQAEWVAYELTREMMDQRRRNNIKRKNNFRDDPSIPTGSAYLDDYKYSGYDRGHLAPAATVGYTIETMSESFYLSNMSPQDPDFNQKKWRLLEEQVREWGFREKALYIVTGPVLEDGLKQIGKRSRSDQNNKRVSVPNYYYKIIIDRTDEPKAIAFLMPNKEIKDSMENYIVSIDHIEEITGIDFFPALEDSLENRLEKKGDIREWKINPKKFQ
ncbi:DNA/RNA non-specific endonuclease [Algivirga pacifica]|uniref:Endonuclease n=1 Tax=Algivirga pacifica TaxID=1162670 RepID=A0ABP9D4W8_9BACT